MASYLVVDSLVLSLTRIFRTCPGAALPHLVLGGYGEGCVVSSPRRRSRVGTRAICLCVNTGFVCCVLVPQVSPDERFDEILGVSDTYIPAASVWVGEYPYLDKVSSHT